MTDSSRPLVTFALFAFNQEKLIRKAVESALSQTYEPLEIILSDDGSTDRTFPIIQEMAAAYVGPHSVKVRQSSPNAGLASHINEVARLARGELIVFGAGDDISKPERTSSLVEEWLSRTGGSTAALYSDFEGIGIDGLPASSESVTREPPNVTDVAQGRCNVLGATTAYTRDVFERFPPMSPDVRHEDRVLPFRSLLLEGQIVFVDRKLVQYRVAGGVSRNAPKSSDDFLRRYTLERHTRVLPDAVQRLADLRRNGAHPSLERKCIRTIAHHRAMMSLATSHSFSLEAVAAKGVLSGAHKKLLLKHYAKMRMRKLFRILAPFR